MVATNRLVWKPTIGVTAIFECKASKTDFIRDARSMKVTLVFLLKADWAC